MKKILFLTMFVSLLFLSACSLKPQAPEENVIPNDLSPADENLIVDDTDFANPNEQIVGGDQDENGCIGSAGYTWCEAKSKCIRVWEENCYAELNDEIKYLLAKKYDKNLAEVNTTINKRTENHAVGSVFFGQAGETGEGGMFLTVKENEVWRLVYDGNGSVDCQELRTRYNFPDEIIVPQFCD